MKFHQPGCRSRFFSLVHPLNIDREYQSPDSKSDPSETRSPSDAKTLSSGIDVISDEAENGVQVATAGTSGAM